MIKQNALIIILPVSQELYARLEQQREKLQALDSTWLQSSSCKPHFISASFISTKPDTRKRQHFAMLEMIVDGSRSAFLNKALEQLEWRELVNTSFELCEGFPGSSATGAELCAYLKTGFKRAELHHVGASYKPVGTVVDEEKVYIQARKDLEQHYENASSRNQVWKELCTGLTKSYFHTIRNARSKPFLEYFNILNVESRSHLRAVFGFFCALFVIAAALLTAYRLVATDFILPHWQKMILISVPTLYFLAGVYVSAREVPKNLKLQYWLQALIENTFTVFIGTVRVLVYLLFILWLLSLEWAAVPDALPVVAAHVTFLVMTLLVALMGYAFALERGALIAGLLHSGLWLYAYVSEEPGFAWFTLYCLYIEAVLYAGLLIFTVYKIRRSELDEKIHRLPEMPSEQPIRPSERVSCHNHMISVTKIRDGFFRLCLIKVLMRLVDFFAFFARVENRGQSEVIHFARFSVLSANDVNYLVFVSSFDDGFSSYLGEFNSFLLNALWGNTQGCPETEFLFWKGAENEIEFRRYARNSMFDYDFYFSAYPDVLLRDRHRATSTCKDLNYPPNDQLVRPLSLSNSLRKKHLEHHELDLAFRRLQ